MALKKDLEGLVDAYKEIIDDLKARNERLEMQVDRLQDALICTRAPEAYRDMKADEAGEPEVDPEALRIARLRADTEAEYLRATEQPLFRDGDEFVDMLEMSLAASASPVDGNSLHDNGES